MAADVPGTPRMTAGIVSVWVTTALIPRRNATPVIGSMTRAKGIKRAKPISPPRPGTRPRNMPTQMPTIIIGKTGQEKTWNMPETAAFKMIRASSISPTAPPGSHARPDRGRIQGAGKTEEGPGDTGAGPLPLLTESSYFFFFCRVPMISW